jgi:hypothetical protein
MIILRKGWFIGSVIYSYIGSQSNGFTDSYFWYDFNVVLANAGTGTPPLPPLGLLSVFNRTSSNLTFFTLIIILLHLTDYDKTSY